MWLPRVISACLVLAAPACAATNEPHRVTTGTWGGDHVRLSVSDTGGAIEFDCAHGSVDEPMLLDENGRFDARGVFIREHGGPVRQGETEDRQPARYKGSVDGATMTLTVVVGDQTLGPFTLVYGRSGRLVKCV